MRSYNQWMDEYAESHQNKINIIIHKICVPLIMWSVLGLLWCIPIFESVSAVSPYINFSTLFALFALVFYATINIKMMLAMVILSLIMFMGIIFLNITTGHVLEISLTVFYSFLDCSVLWTQNRRKKTIIS